jgi:hypothetical protein
MLVPTIVGATLGGAIIYWIKPWLDNTIWQVIWTYLFFMYLFTAFVFTLGLSCYVLAYLYRLSLKSTALIWLPLVYVVHITFDGSVKLSVQLEEMRQSALWKILRILSWVTLVLLAAKIVILPTIIDWWNSQLWTKVLDVYVMPNVIHPWHLATGLNSVIALLGFYYFIDRAPLRLSEGIWTETKVLRGLQVFTFVRGTISIYTILVGLYLTVSAARSMNWPAWSGRIVPW